VRRDNVRRMEYLEVVANSLIKVLMNSASNYSVNIPNEPKVIVYLYNKR